MNGVERSNDGVKLLKCPFCGGEAELQERFYEWDGRIYDNTYVVCTKCYSSSENILEIKIKDRKKREEEVVKAWNTRKPLERVVKRLKDVSFVDIDEAYADDGQRMLFLHDAIECIKEEVG